MVVFSLDVTVDFCSKYFVIGDEWNSYNKASSPYNNSTIGAIDDLDALIVVDIQFIDGASLDDDTRHQIANIQFNNLDIIGKSNTCLSIFRNIFL